MFIVYYDDKKVHADIQSDPRPQTNIQQGANDRAAKCFPTSAQPRFQPTLEIYFCQGLGASLFREKPKPKTR